jgi:hypothetical protein
MKVRTIGCAKRVRVKMPLGKTCRAWDCRHFGLGRIVTPVLPIEIELNPGMHLDVHTGKVWVSPTSLAA